MQERKVVNFSVEFQGQADLIVYYWTKNKQEVNFQLLQTISSSTYWPRNINYW